MSNVVHPKLDPDVVEDFEEDDEDDPITGLPFNRGKVIFGDGLTKFLRTFYELNKNFSELCKNCFNNFVRTFERTF